MTERDLRRRVSAPAPGEADARERAWPVVRSAFETREPAPAEFRFARPALALALAAAVVAAAVSPPGRAVVESVRRAVGVERAAPTLLRLPARGSLLVNSAAGPWIVATDGSRRYLGRYREASWSPHGRFVVAATSNELVALEPKGAVRWSLPRPRVRHPRWGGTLLDTRIAYLSGTALRVVAGDGTGDRLLARRVAPVAAAWRPRYRHLLAYAEHDGRVTLVDADRGRTLWRTQRGGSRIVALEWSSDGRRLLVQRVDGPPIEDDVTILTGAGQPWTGVRLERGGVTAAAFRPGSHALAYATAAGGRGRVNLIAENGGLLFAGAGRFTRFAWSPDGRWLLIPWREADQWLFVRARRPAKLVAVANVSSQFRSSTFPSPAGWIDVN